MTVTNSSVDTIPADAAVVVCQRVLADRAAKCAPQAQLVTLENFLADPHLDALYLSLRHIWSGRFCSSLNRKNSSICRMQAFWRGRSIAPR